MRHANLQIYLVAFLVLMLSLPLSAQNRSMNPDSLQEVILTGIAFVDTSNAHPDFFIDTDDDSVIDYKLNFGPWWYQPDSGSARRPADGDEITIFGGLHDSECDSFDVVLVYEINGEFWRDPYEPSWARMGKFRKHHRHSKRNHHGFAFGWLNDSLEIIEVQGVALVDTTFHFSHHYIDTDGDTLPDYFLNFGPPWYQPAAEISKPGDGDSISVSGAVAYKSEPPVLFVFTLNGETWVDTTGYGGQLGGGWIHKNMNRTRHIKAPFDSLTSMRVRQGWHSGGQGGHQRMPDSIFCQMLQLFPENVPNAQNQKAFAAFEIGAFDKSGKNMLLHNDSVGGSMRFNNQMRFQFHYNEVQVRGYNRNENTIHVKIWNGETQSWDEVEGANLDTESNTVTFESEEVNGLVILTAEAATTIEDAFNGVPQLFVLKQNYPNPFNPQTTIEFTLEKQSDIKLSIYNVLGQKLYDIASGTFDAGLNKVVFDGSRLASGVYFYELKAAGRSQIMKMTLIK